MVAAVVSEAVVPVAPYQQVPGTDLTAMGTLGQGSLDNVVGSCLYDGTVYTGMAASQVGTSNIVLVQPGYLIKGGPAYSLRDPFPVDVSSAIAQVPDSSKTLIVCIVADGQEFPTTESRTFVDASKLPTDPTSPAPTVTQATPIRVVRSVVISSPNGAADVQPSPPAFSANLALVATVVVSNTAIVSVKQATAQQIVRQDQIAATVATLSAYQSTLEGTLTNLLSSVSALALGLANLNAREQADVSSLQRQLDQLRITATTPAASTFTGQDLFLDLTQSLPAAPGYNALVNGGLRFPVGKADVPIATQNPYDGNLQQGAGTLLYPAVTSLQYLTRGDPNLSLIPGNGYIPFRAFGTLGAVSLPVVRRGYGRSRIRSSVGLKTTSPAQVLANGDPSQLFAIDPTTFTYDAADWGPWQTPTTEIVRQNGYWADLTSRDYWTPILGTGNTGGLPAISQPFTPATSCMLSTLYLLSNTPNGLRGVNVRLLVCGDLNGKPDLTNTYADVSIVTGTVGDGGVRDLFTMPAPVLLKGGRGYHFVITADNPAYCFYPAQNVNDSVNQSPPFLAYANGDWAVAAAGQSVSMSLGFAQFKNPTITIPLAPLQLTGGGDTVDFQASLVLPDGCSIGYQVFIGGKWVALAQVLNSTYPLAGNPSNVPCNLLLTGTSAVVPIIDTSASASRISKSAAAMEHVSSIQAPPAPVTTVHKSVVLDNWNAAVHTLNAGLRTGPGFATPAVAPTSTKDAVQTDGSLLRTWTWTLGSAVPSFEMELDGATTDPTQQFVGRRSNWDAAP